MFLDFFIENSTNRSLKMFMIERNLIGCFYAWRLCLRKTMYVRVYYKYLGKLGIYECVLRTGRK